MIQKSNVNSVITLSANSSWYLFNFRRSTINYLIKKKFKIYCLIPDNKYLIQLKELGCECVNIPIARSGVNPFLDIYSIYKFYKAYRKINPILAFHFTIKNNIYGTLGAWFAKIPSVNNFSGLGTTFIKNNFVSMIVKFLYRISQPLAHKVFCQNQDDYYLLTSLGLVSEDKLKVLPGSGVDLKRFQPNAIKKEPDVNFKFLYAGRFLADKGLYELIEAATKIYKNNTKFKLILCGAVDLQNRSSISKKTIEEWNSFEFVKILNMTDKIEGVLSKSDCVVLPSYREGMPRILLEAMAMGLPIITTDVPGCREIISDQHNGYICMPHDSNSLKNAMKKVMSLDSKSLQVLGQNGRTLVEENYDERLVIKSAHDVIKEII